MNELREEVARADALKKKKQLEEGPKAAFGYGGKFGVQKDRSEFIISADSHSNDSKIIEAYSQNGQ